MKIKETIGKILFYGVGNAIVYTLTGFVVVRDYLFSSVGNLSDYVSDRLQEKKSPTCGCNQGISEYVEKPLDLKVCFKCVYNTMLGAQKYLMYSRELERDDIAMAVSLEYFVQELATSSLIYSSLKADYGEHILNSEVGLFCGSRVCFHPNIKPQKLAVGTIEEIKSLPASEGS